MIESMVLFIFVVLAFVFVVAAKKYSSQIGKGIQDTAKEMFIEEREKKRE